jgi:uncharacterized repeat protein (TIGR01451 family)
MARSIPSLEALENRIVPVLFFTADLQVLTVTPTPAPAIAGAAESFVTTIRNNGPLPVFSMNLQDHFSNSLSNVSFTPSSGNYSPATGMWTGFTLPAGATISLTATGTLDSASTGTTSVTSNLNPDPGVYDPDLDDNSASSLAAIGLSGDLSISDTDNLNGVLTPGGQVIYTVVVSNAGPSTINGASVTDNLPTGITSDTWTATASNGASVTTASGSGNIANTVNLAPGANVTYSITATVDPNATGPIANTASVAPPSGTIDPNSANNSATDTLALTADLSISNTDNSSPAGTAEPGSQIVYTVIVASAGPSAVTGATVVDDLPAGISSDSWTAVASNGASVTDTGGTGNINTTVNLATDANVTFTITATIDPTATGTLATTATVTAPTGVTDPTSSNNSVTDTLTLAPTADLSITNTDNVSHVLTPGGQVVYTIVVSSSGPSAVTGASVADSLPAGITGDTWTAVASSGASVASASGTGNIATTVNLTSGSTVTFTVTATVSSTASGSVANTATVTAPTGVNDADTANNTATDTLSLTADLSVTNTDNSNPAGTAIPGNQVVYTVVVSNAGPSDVTGATVTDDLPAGISSDTWSATASSGASVNQASGTGNVFTTVDLPSGAIVTFTITATIDPAATGTLQATATIGAPSGIVDPVTTNNSATDTLTLVPTGDLSTTITDNSNPSGTVTAGGQVVYTVVVSNAGPSTATGAAVTDTPPAGFTSESWTAVASTGASVDTASGTSSISTGVTLAPGSSVTFTVTAMLSPSGTGNLTYMAGIAAPAAFTDTNSLNNSATDTLTFTA